MTLGLVGRKVGMTRIFADDGSTIPVTVLDVSNNRVTQIKTPDTDGYAAVQVTFGKRRASRVNKAAAGHLAKAGVEAGVVLREFRVTQEQLAGFKPGDVVSVSIFAVGQKVDVSGTSIGKGFTGAIKRYHFSSTAPRTATPCRTIPPAPSAWRRIRAACFRASAWPVTLAMPAAPSRVWKWCVSMRRASCCW